MREKPFFFFFSFLFWLSCCRLFSAWKILLFCFRCTSTILSEQKPPHIVSQSSAYLSSTFNGKGRRRRRVIRFSVLPFLSISPNITLCGRLDSKHQLTNSQSCGGVCYCGRGSDLHASTKPHTHDTRMQYRLQETHKGCSTRSRQFITMAIKNVQVSAADACRVHEAHCMNCWQRKPMPEPKGRYRLGGSAEALMRHWWSRDREVVGGIPAPGEISRTQKVLPVTDLLQWNHCLSILRKRQTPRSRGRQACAR